MEIAIFRVTYFLKGPFTEELSILNHRVIKVGFPRQHKTALDLFYSEEREIGHSTNIS